LTVVGTVTKEDFEKRFDEMFPKRADVYKIVVLVDRERDHIIGAGTIFFEKKFMRKLGIVITHHLTMIVRTY
jgi:glucosamine-phosphate N-acetyltransferase